MEGINGTSETLGWYYKRMSNQQWNVFSNNKSEEKILEKNLLEFKKRKERENNVRDLEIVTREYT